MIPAKTTAVRKCSKLPKVAMALKTITVKPAAGPLTPNGDLLIEVTTIPPTIPAIIPLIRELLKPLQSQDKEELLLKRLQYLRENHI